MLGRFQFPFIATEVGKRIAFQQIKQGGGNLPHCGGKIMVKGSYLVINTGVRGDQALLHGLIFREVYAPVSFQQCAAPFQIGGRHPGPEHRTPGTPADTYVGACRSLEYIRCGFQRNFIMIAALCECFHLPLTSVQVSGSFYFLREIQELLV